MLKSLPSGTAKAFMSFEPGWVGRRGCPDGVCWDSVFGMSLYPVLSPLDTPAPLAPTWGMQAAGGAPDAHHTECPWPMTWTPPW